jgi:hypothetical protein
MYKVRDYNNYFEELEERGVFFSYPMDLDFAMIDCFPDAFAIGEEDLVTPEESDIKSVLGKSHDDASEYDDDEQKLFCSYHKLFKLGSKPAAHINALSNLTNEQLSKDMPVSLDNMIDSVIEKLEELPE